MISCAKNQNTLPRILSIQNFKVLKTDGKLPFATRRDVGGEGVLAVHDHGERLAVVGLLERGGTAHQHVQDDTQRPNI